MFYSKALDKNVYVFFGLIVWLGDQLERRIINCMLGGGNFGSRFGYSTNSKKIKELILVYTLHESYDVWSLVF